MALRMTATEVEEIAEGLWSFEMPPHQVRLFGGAPTSVGARSVIILTGCEFNAKSRELYFEADRAVAVNVGTKSKVIGLDSQLRSDLGHSSGSKHLTDIEGSYGLGDKEFVRLAKVELSSRMHKAAIVLLNGVRAISPGDLKKGLGRNFSDTPDNFWYVILQPRIDQMSITVRGPIDHFANMARLPIKDDRGNTLFKVTDEKDVPAALDMIFHAKRKR